MASELSFEINAVDHASRVINIVNEVMMDSREETEKVADTYTRLGGDLSGVESDLDRLIGVYQSSTPEMVQYAQAISTIKREFEAGNLSSKDAVSQLKNIQTEMKGAKLSTKDLSIALMGINQAFELVERGAQAVKKGFEFAEAGAQIQKLDADFEKLAISINTTGYALENDLSEKTRGMIADATLAAGAADMMSLGLAKTHDQAVRLTAVASQLNMNMDALTLTLTNQTDKRFDTLHMKVDGFDEKLKELKATGMDVNDAFTEAFLQQAEEQVALLGDSADSSIAPFQQLDVQFQNLGNDLKVVAAVISGPLVQSMADFMSVQNDIRNAGDVIAEAVDLGLIGYWEGEWAALTATNEEWLALAGDLEEQIAEYNLTIEANIDNVVEMERAEMEAAAASRHHAVEMEIATATGNEYAQFYEHMTDATRDAIDANRQYNEVMSIAGPLRASLNGDLDEQIANLEEMKAQYEELTPYQQEFGEGAELAQNIADAEANINAELMEMVGNVGVLALLESGFEGSEQAAYDLALQLGLMDQATYNANMTMANLNEFLEDTEDLDTYGRAAEWVADNLDRLQDKTYTITEIRRFIRYEEASGNSGLGQDEMPSGYSDYYPQADGGDYIVSEPTVFVAGEAGMERATFTPMSSSGLTPAPSGGGGQPIIINFNGPVAGSQAQLERMFKQAAKEVFREQEALRR